MLCHRRLHHSRNIFVELTNYFVGLECQTHKSTVASESNPPPLGAVIFVDNMSAVAVGIANASPFNLNLDPQNVLNLDSQKISGNLKKPRKASIRIDLAGQISAPPMSPDRDVPRKKTFKGRMMGLRELHERRADRFENAEDFEPMKEELKKKREKLWERTKRFLNKKKRQRSIRRLEKQVSKEHLKQGLGVVKSQKLHIVEDEQPASSHTLCTVSTSLSSLSSVNSSLRSTSQRSCF